MMRQLAARPAAHLETLHRTAAVLSHAAAAAADDGQADGEPTRPASYLESLGRSAAIVKAINAPADDDNGGGYMVDVKDAHGATVFASAGYAKSIEDALKDALKFYQAMRANGDIA